MTFSKLVLVFLVFFSIIFFKNNVLTQYWPILGQLSFLPFMIWAVCVSEKRWYFALISCLLVAFLLEFFSFSIFSFHILLSIGLFLLAQTWISFFSITSGSLLGFCLTASGVEIFFIIVLQYFTRSVQHSWLFSVELLALSFFLNLLVLSAWLYYFPPERLNNVE